MEVQYSEDLRTAFFDGYKFRKDMKTGYYLSTRKTDQGKRERLHCYVWRFHNGDIPTGFHVHHVDGDKNNNEIRNLRCIRGESHAKYHFSKRAIDNYDDVCKNLLEKAAPKAMEWHHSQDGRVWHSEHAKRTVANLVAKKFVCPQCGKVFFKKPLGAVKYCSNSCKTKARYKSGVDNEPRRCVVCGGEFVVNKYSSQKCCSPQCGYKLRWDTRREKVRQRAGL